MRRSGANTLVYMRLSPRLSKKGHLKRCPGRDAFSSRFYMFDANSDGNFAANMGCGEYPLPG